MKIMIAVPCMDEIDSQFVKSLWNIDKVGNVTLEMSESSLVYDSRNRLAELAVANKYDYVLWLDSDMVFNSDLLTSMMNDLNTGKDYISGLFFSRRPPYEPAIWKTIKFGLLGDSESIKYLDYPKNQMFEIDAGGMAAVLMKTEMLEACIKEFHTVFQPMNGYGEDLSACIRFKKLGYKLWCDSRIKVGHMGKTTVGELTYNAWKNANQ